MKLVVGSIVAGVVVVGVVAAGPQAPADGARNDEGRVISSPADGQVAGIERNTTRITAQELQW